MVKANFFKPCFSVAIVAPGFLLGTEGLRIQTNSFRIQDKYEIRSQRRHDMNPEWEDQRSDETPAYQQRLNKGSPYRSTFSGFGTGSSHLSKIRLQQNFRDKYNEYDRYGHMGSFLGRPVCSPAKTGNRQVKFSRSCRHHMLDQQFSPQQGGLGPGSRSKLGPRPILKVRGKKGNGKRECVKLELLSSKNRSASGGKRPNTFYRSGLNIPSKSHSDSASSSEFQQTAHSGRNEKQGDNPSESGFWGDPNDHWSVRALDAFLNIVTGDWIEYW